MTIKLNRRSFLTETATVAGTFLTAGAAGTLVANETEVGRQLPAWKPGEMFLHFIHTGVGENMFYLFPDGTTMLLDAADRAWNDAEIPTYPKGTEKTSDGIIDYIDRVAPNPEEKSLDYMMLSHYHRDHAGDPKIGPLTSGRGEEYRLTGLSRIGEEYKIGQIIDRGLPHPNSVDQEVYQNFSRFVRWKTTHDKVAYEPFQVGALDQFELKKNKSAYPNFHIRNLAANAEVWTGKENETIDLFPMVAEGKMDENSQSLAILISYGAFRFYTGGDIDGRFLDTSGEDIHLDGRVGTAAGEVDVCKTNHHGSDGSMRMEFTSAVRARVYMNNVWSANHLSYDTMTKMTRDRAIDETMVCPTWAPASRFMAMKEQPFFKYLVPAYGHIVVRVIDGGDRYIVYHLDIEMPNLTVKAAYGPFESKGK